MTMPQLTVDNVVIADIGDKDSSIFTTFESHWGQGKAKVINYDNKISISEQIDTHVKETVTVTVSMVLEFTREYDKSPNELN